MTLALRGASGAPTQAQTLTSSGVIAVLDEIRLDAIVWYANLISSYASSAAEAAWRGDQRTAGVHLRQVRVTTIAALKTFNELGTGSGEKTGAA